jgi:hypothetical protein
MKFRGDQIRLFQLLTDLRYTQARLARILRIAPAQLHRYWHCNVELPEHLFIKIKDEIKKDREKLA